MTDGKGAVGLSPFNNRPTLLRRVKETNMAGKSKKPTPKSAPPKPTMKPMMLMIPQPKKMGMPGMKGKRGC